MRFHLEATSFGRLKRKITQAVAKNTKHLIKLTSIDMFKYLLRIAIIISQILLLAIHQETQTFI